MKNNKKSATFIIGIFEINISTSNIFITFYSIYIFKITALFYNFASKKAEISKNILDNKLLLLVH